MAAPPHPMAPAPARARPMAVGRRVLRGGVLANLLAVEFVFWTGPAAKNEILEVGRFLGLHLAFALALQFVLISRLPWLDARIGMDRLTSWHRWVGFAVFWLALAHPSVILFGFVVLSSPTPALNTAGGLLAQPPVAAGLLSVLIIVAVAVASIRRMRRKLSYERWHAIHFLLYAVLVLATYHQLIEGASFGSSPFVRAYWWLMWAAAIVVLIAGRIVTPIVRNRRHRFRVSAVVPEAGGATSVYVTGRDLHLLPARAGQFCIWRFPDHNPWWQANPFSLSAAPGERGLRLTAKGVGTTSRGLADLEVGTRVFVEGPYGAFTAMHRVRESTLLVAAGIGITPVRALLEELPEGTVTVLYRARTPADAPLLDETADLCRRRGAVLHLLAGRTADGDPLAAENIRRLVPDVTDRDVYVCGPPPLTAAVVRTMEDLGVPAEQIHDERFGFAG